MDLTSLSISDVIQLASLLVGLGVLYGRIVSLEKKVDTHNKVIERVYKLEQNIGNNDIGAMNQKIEDTREQVSKITPPYNHAH